MANVLNLSDIFTSIIENEITIITSPTGSGKSTQIPKMLMEEGYNVVVTEPRRIAAQSLATYVAELCGEHVGNKVGYITGVSRAVSDNTKLTYVTDGLEVVRQLANKNIEILIVDEVHEWNLNVEILLWWAKENIGKTIERLVIMSATADVSPIKKYFSFTSTCHFDVEVERTFNIEMGYAIEGEDKIKVIERLVKDGKNILVFEPGKREITETIEKIKDLTLDITILPLHGELSVEEQEKIFKNYTNPKVVVATNIAQTSITIDDIDVVVDSQLERSVKYINGVERLTRSRISKADSTQRAGRVGRTRAGVYYNMYVGDDEQADYSIPEIQRLSLDSVVLKLANINIDARNIEFVHQPSFINIENSMDTLYMLGLLDMGRKITELGKKVNKLPISPRYGRMLIEAVRYGVADVVSAVVAIMEIGQLSIKDFVYNKTVKSDLELNIDLFIQGCGLRTQGARHYEYKEEGISWRTFDRVYELFMKINRIANRIEDEEYYNSEMDEMERVKASILSGSKDRIYRYRRTVFIGDDMEKRLLPRDSKTKYEVAVCGVPFDIELVNNRGPYVLKLITLSFGM